VKRQTRSCRCQVHLGMVLAAMWVLAAASSSLSEARTDADRHSAVAQLPPQSTFWRFLASLHLAWPGTLTVQWRCANGLGTANVQLHSLTVDTDTTVHTLFGNQMGARKDITEEQRKKSYQRF